MITVEVLAWWQIATCVLLGGCVVEALHYWERKDDRRIAAGVAARIAERERLTRAGHTGMPRTGTLFLLAGNRSEAGSFAAENGLGDYDWAYIANADSLRGLNLRPDQVRRIGTYKARPDYEEIEDAINLSTRL